MQGTHMKRDCFSWRGIDREGHPQTGIIDASSEALARVQLQRQGLRNIALRKGTALPISTTSSSNKPRTLFQQRISSKDIAIFTRQLATMLQAGVALLQALDIAIRGARQSPIQPLLETIRRDVAQGDSLHTALSRHPRQFDTLFCNLVRAAEHAGMLDTMLERIADYREKSLALRGKIRSALTYPCAVVFVALAVTAVIMLWVVPSFEQIFSNFGAELPLPTRIVMNMSAWLGHHWAWLLATSILLPLALQQSWQRSTQFQANLQRASLRVPLFGPLLRKAAIARWSRTFGTLFAAGISLIEALDMAGGAAGNAAYADASRQMRSALGNGASVHAAMQSANVFPDLAVQMAAIGEESGALEAMLSKIAEFNEREVDASIAALTSLMEPIIMTVLGLLIGGLVVAMYLPIFRMGSVV